MGAAERIEWQRESPALLRSDHPCDTVGDGRETLLWWSQHPVLLWREHPCDAIWDEVEPEVCQSPANDNAHLLVPLGREARESGTKNTPTLVLRSKTAAASSENAATSPATDQTSRTEEGPAQILDIFTLARAVMAEGSKAGARALGEEARPERRTRQGEAQPAQAQAALTYVTFSDARRAEQAGGWGLTLYEVSHYTAVPYLMAGGVRLARLVYHGEDEVPEEDTSTDGSFGDVNASVSNLHVFFELGDHLGSTSVVLDKATGELVERATFQGYGGAESDYRPGRWRSFREDYKFTGKEEDVEVGLQYFGKRFLNPLLGRWVSADPLAVHAPGEADLNVYAYVSGQILKAIDPLGLDQLNTDAAAESTGAGGNREVEFGADTIEANQSVAPERGADALQASPNQEKAKSATEDGVTVTVGVSGRHASKGAYDAEGTLNLHFTRDHSGITVSLEVDFNLGLNVAAGAGGYTWEASVKGEGGGVPEGKGPYVKASLDDVDDKDGAIIDGSSGSATHYVDGGPTELSVAGGHDFGRAGGSLHLDTNLSDTSSGIDVGSGNASLSLDFNTPIDSSGVGLGGLKGGTVTLGDGSIRGSSIRTGGNMVFSTPTFAVPDMVLKLEAYAADKLQ